MKLYLLERSKADYSVRLICANFKTVLDAISGLDGSDEVITVNFLDVADTSRSSNPSQIKK